MSPVRSDPARPGPRGESRPAAADRRLVAACLRGEAEAWETLIQRYRRLIFSIPVAWRLPPDEAEEIFQRVTILLFENLEGLRRVESLPAWLATTARRECLAHRRRSRRYTGLEDAGPEPAEEPPDVVERMATVVREHRLAEAFERLGSPCRELLLALYLEEPTPAYAEIAERLGRPIGSLGPTRQRCLAKLRRLYLASGGSIGPTGEIT